MGHRVRLSSRAPALIALAGAALVATSSLARTQIVFQPPRVSDAGGMCMDLVVGDFDGDGVPDALVSHFPFSPQPLPSFVRGLGDGSFAPPVTIPFTSNQRVKAAGDFNEDGDLDVAVTDWTTSAVAVALGNGRGGFDAPLPLAAVPYTAPETIDVADFDVDGHLDLVIQYTHLQIQLGGLVVAFGHGDGHFDNVIVFQFPLGPFVEGVHSAHAGDTNGDGVADIVVTSQGQPPVFLSDGDGTFTNVPCSGCYGFTEAFDLADLNGDGRDDAVTTSKVLLAEPSGGFGPPQPLVTGIVPNRVALADFDGDGNADAAVSRNYVTETFSTLETAGDVLVLRGNGDGTFQQPGVVVSHVPQPRGLAAADADLDGRPDLIVAEMQDAPSSLRTLLNHTYPPGSPYLDLGGALGGSNGYPIQLASGTLVAGQPFAFKLLSGPPSGFAYHIVGLSALNAPFKGGTLIPFPHLLNGPLPLNAQGAITLAANWPAGGSGLTLWIQFWMPNGGGPAGFVASSGVRAQIP